MTRQFASGFAFGLVIFLAINLLAAHLAWDYGLPAVIGRDACADDIARAGWPFQFYEEGGFAYRSHFNTLFLLFNIIVGAGVSLLTGWFTARYKKSPPK